MAWPILEVRRRTHRSHSLFPGYRQRIALQQARLSCAIEALHERWKFASLSMCDELVVHSVGCDRATAKSLSWSLSRPSSTSARQSSRMRWILCFFQSATAHPDKWVPGVYQTLRQGLDGIWIELAAWLAFLQLAKCHPFDAQILYVPPLLDKKSSNRKDVRPPRVTQNFKKRRRLGVA